MKFSWKWLNQTIDLHKIPLHEVIHKLTLAGFEIEDIENKKQNNDKTLNISITTNRSDTLSIIGLANELSSLFNIHLDNKKKENHINTTKEYTQIEFVPNQIIDLQLSIINHINPVKSPKWLQEYLLGCDIIPKNSFIDVKEYINIKWGQAIEFLDAKKVSCGDLDKNLVKITNIDASLHYAEKMSNQFTYLEGLTYKNKVLSIFGLGPNPEISCYENTSSIIILGYICETEYTKKILKILKSKTDISEKHIKGLSRHNFRLAYEEVINLILNIYSVNHQINRFYYETRLIKTQNILLHRQKINHILGPCSINSSYLTAKEITQILQQLKFEPRYTDNIFLVTIPEYRNLDIKRPIDVIEEIGRIHGFNHFIDKLPLRNQTVYTSGIAKLIKKIRTILRSLGLHEVMHYSLDNKFQSKSSVSLYNPLSGDQTHLKNNLIYKLLDTIKYNQKHKNLTLECFEIGRIFYQKLPYNNKSKYKENFSLAGVIGNDFSKTLWSEKGQNLTWFQAKGTIENLLEELHAKVTWNTVKDLTAIEEYQSFLKICHPHRCAILQNKTNGKILGIFSEIKQKYFKQLKENHNYYIFELNLLKLLETIQPHKHLNYLLKQYSAYPSTIRDISLTLNKNTKADFIQKIILLNNNALVKNVEILNEYYLNNKTNKNRNVSFRIIYKSNIKTLNETDICNIDKDINSLSKMLNRIVHLRLLE